MDVFDRNDRERVLDLGDGRVLFLPAGTGGRAYYVQSVAQARRLNQQLTWAERLSSLAVLGVLGAQSWLKDSSVLLFAVPAVLAPVVARTAVTWALDEATDYNSTRPEGTAGPGVDLPRVPENRPIVPR